MKIVHALFVIALAISLPASGQSSDWPMWRHDAARSGSTDQPLPDNLRLKWSWNLGPTTPAWPASQTKLQFDAGFEPVCADGRLVIGSPVDGRVIAFDVASGEQLWTYFTEGPVRFAPALHDGRAYVVSDDGYLHCLAIEDGSRQWRVNGGPSQRRVIGNDRLISMWPVRGGVVVHEGVAYFSAGIWPSMGVFVRAVDARNGDVLWTNSTTGSRFITHPHGADSFGSISPQGYLAISGDTLLVPGGRTLPAGFDLKTGELRHFEFGGKGAGGFEVLTSGDWYFVADNAFRAFDGASVGQIPVRISDAARVIGNDGSRIVVTEIGSDVTEKTETDRRGKKLTRLTVQTDRVSQFEVDGPSGLFLQADDRVFAASDGRIAAYSLQEQSSPRKPVWSETVAGEVWSMIAADGCLFVTTRDGRLYCFASDGVDAAKKPTEFALTSDALEVQASSTKSSSETALSLEQHVPEFSSKVPGYAICLGAPELPVLNHLLEETDLYVVVLEPSEERATDFRTAIATDSRFGRRFCVLNDSLISARLPDCLASLVVCRSDTEIDSKNPAEINELVRVLRPYGGTCCIPLEDDEYGKLTALISRPETAGATLSRSGEWSVIRRQGPLPGSGVWSHQYGDASNSVVSADSRVKPPFGLLWFGGPSNDRVLPRHGHGPSPQVAGGRLFIEGPDMLRCVDVYNGQVWWERDLPGLGEYYDNTSHHPGAGEIGSNYVSLEDAVYVVYGKQLLELNAKTGETTRDFELEAGSSTTWGSVLVDGDVVFATANPVAVSGVGEKPKLALPENSQPLMPEGAEWSYLAGMDPSTEWTALDFKASGWKKGKAGFGYGDNDDRTVLKDMPGKYRRVYIRRDFEFPEAGSEGSLSLVINFDDAFIAYLNGHEIHRVNVASGSGSAAKSIGSHEAGGPEIIALPDASKWLKPGRNVLAIEGHNTSISSSDFTLDPWLALVPRSDQSKPAPAKRSLAGSFETTKYSSASRLLVAFDRKTGRQLWSRTADFNFRHNAMCAANGRLYCIDALSSEKLAVLKRRGIEPRGQARLVAIDATSGRELWSTTENVFGTFLSYSREHDVLLQAGSAYRDRAKDEVKQGMVAYRGETGDIVWKDLALGYGGPCLLRHDRIITNGGGGFELELLSGKKTGWSYQRMYGCNTAIGSEHLLTFRSGAAGFCDLSSDSGTGNLGGFRSSCTSNLVVADGVLNAPDYTRTCSCAYQLQTSLALIHDPDNEFWAFGHTDFTSQPVSSIGFNLGAPGDRRDDQGVLWFEYPIVGGPSPKLDVEAEPQNVTRFHQHSSLMAHDPLNWIGASGLQGVRTIRLKAPMPRDTRKVSLRLVFAEPDDRKPGERVFDIDVNGRRVLSALDIAAEASGPNRTVVRDIDDVEFDGSVEIQLTSRPGSEEPVISGIAVLTQ